MAALLAPLLSCPHVDRVPVAIVYGVGNVHQQYKLFLPTESFLRLILHIAGPVKSNGECRRLLNSQSLHKKILAIHRSRIPEAHLQLLKARLM